MGVPGFFAWILKKYRNKDIIIPVNKLNQKVDVLYLDANCLFHPQCFKILDHYKNKNKNVKNLEKITLKLQHHSQILRLKRNLKNQKI